MASSSNLMDEFEEAFQACLHALTKQESNTGVAKDEIELEVQQTANKFIDVARQMEAFFLQKRFLTSALKPELLLKHENQELRFEIQRKDVLINKHYNRLEEWKSLLSDTQQPGYNKGIPNPNQSELRPPINSGGMPPQPANSMMGGVMPNAGPMQQMQHQQQQMLHSQQHPIQQMQVNAQQMYMPQGPGNMGQRPGPPFNPSGNTLLQGPLAYLEKTTSNIDMVGMGDGRSRGRGRARGRVRGRDSTPEFHDSPLS